MARNPWETAYTGNISREEQERRKKYRVGKGISGAFADKLREEELVNEVEDVQREDDTFRLGQSRLNEEMYGKTGAVARGELPSGEELPLTEDNAETYTQQLRAAWGKEAPQKYGEPLDYSSGDFPSLERARRDAEARKPSVTLPTTQWEKIMGGGQTITPQQAITATAPGGIASARPAPDKRSLWQRMRGVSLADAKTNMEFRTGAMEAKQGPPTTGGQKLPPGGTTARGMAMLFPQTHGRSVKENLARVSPAELQGLQLAQSSHYRKRPSRGLTMRPVVPELKQRQDVFSSEWLKRHPEVDTKNEELWPAVSKRIRKEFWT